MRINTVKTKKLTPCYFYCRVSGLGQKDGHGPERQREAATRCAKEHGFTIVKEYADLGVSGTNELENRPALWSMLQAIILNGVRVVLVENMTRLARDLYVQEKIIAELRKHGVQLLSTSEGEMLTADPSRELVRQIMGAVSGYDKKMIVTKLKVAREAKKAVYGKCEGKKGFGECDAGERAIVSRVRELRRKCPGKAALGAARIAALLNREGLPSRSGVWNANKINAIMRGRVYEALGRRGT